MSHCSLVEVYWHFKESCAARILYPDDGGSWIFWNIISLPPVSMGSHPRKQHSSQSLWREHRSLNLIQIHSLVLEMTCRKTPSTSCTSCQEHTQSYAMNPMSSLSLYILLLHIFSAAHTHPTYSRCRIQSAGILVWWNSGTGTGGRGTGRAHISSWQLTWLLEDNPRALHWSRWRTVSDQADMQDVQPGGTTKGYINCSQSATRQLKLLFPAYPLKSK